eukprot:TRINITY_DN3834_c0_g1_i1.p1 TRINITY_DN3834_c0_g1~~TRINITY_DN3834_c0_g1_i1.p1  ORF type:complete len:405 (+),score=108.92 TRINITY_DN3834_c0_g1_i1:77-1291(+)
MEMDARRPNESPGADGQDIDSVIETMTRSASVAVSSWKRGQTALSVMQMEQAVELAKGRAAGHPGLAVECVRAQLNLCALLSENGEHQQALEVVREAQQMISDVLGWATSCGGADAAVDAIAQEAQVLLCGTHVAEGIATEALGQQEGTMPKPPAEPLHRARAVAESNLPPVHPMAFLAHRLSDSGAVCAKQDQASKARTFLAEQRSKGAPLKLPTLREGGYAQHPSFCLDDEEEADDDDGEPQTPTSSQAGLLASSQAKCPRQMQRRGSSMRRLVRRHKNDKEDVFKEFLKEKEHEKLERIRSLSNSWEEDVRKRLNQNHRLSRLQLLLNKDNGLKEAKQHRKAPEVWEMKKLVKQVYVKPPTPPPAPPPKVVAQARAADGLKGLFSGMKVSFKASAERHEIS